MSVSSKFSRSHTKFHTKRVQHCLVTPRFACSMTILSGWMMNESPQALEVGKMKWMWSSKTWHQKIWKAALCNVYIYIYHISISRCMCTLSSYSSSNFKLSNSPILAIPGTWGEPYRCSDCGQDVQKARVLWMTTFNTCSRWCYAATKVRNLWDQSLT